MPRPIVRQAMRLDEETVERWAVMSPEEFSGRYPLSSWGCFSMHTLSYSDPRLQAWMDRFYEINWESPGERERCCELYGEKHRRPGFFERLVVRVLSHFGRPDPDSFPDAY